jgi:hypothetical protein
VRLVTVSGDARHRRLGARFLGTSSISARAASRWDHRPGRPGGTPGTGDLTGGARSLRRLPAGDSMGHSSGETAMHRRVRSVELIAVT